MYRRLAAVVMMGALSHAVSPASYACTRLVYLGDEGVVVTARSMDIDREISFGDRTFAIGAGVGARYLSADDGFAVVATPTVEFGTSIGVTAVRLASGIEASASVSGSAPTSRESARQVDYDLPIPLPGLFLNVQMHPRVRAVASARGLKGSLDEYSAALAEARAGVEVTLARPLAIGGAYYFNRARLTRNETRTDGEIVYRFHGPLVYGALGW